ncbi:hypothetical protein ACWDFL_36135 [Streptomyces bungoensis]
MTLEDRATLARHIIDFGMTEADVRPHPADADTALLASAPGQARLLATQHTLAPMWPPGLAPVPEPIAPEPPTGRPLPAADYLVVTWTVSEQQALADVLTPGVPRERWHRYDRHFADHYLPQIRSTAPSRVTHRLASYCPVRIGGRSVLCVKSELHLNQDGIRRDGEGTATLSVRDLFAQMIAEVRPSLVITTGTAGAAAADQELGDVMVTRAARFRLAQEFRNEPFAHAGYRSEFEVRTAMLGAAEPMLAATAGHLVEPDYAPPTTAYPQYDHPLPGRHNIPDIKLDGRGFPAFHPVLTTDSFEFGTSANHLDQEGCGVEMGDAVLGMVAEGLGGAAPRWLVVRNASDPQINGDRPVKPDVQAMWAVFFSEQYGYWTSVDSAIATWAVIAGDHATA